MSLHIEDELGAIDRRSRQLQIALRLGRKVVEAATLSGACVGRIHRQQGRCRAASGYEEVTPTDTETTCNFGGGVARAAAGLVVHGLQRNRRVFAVGRGVEFDRQTLALRIMVIAHQTSHAGGRQTTRSYDRLGRCKGSRCT